MNQPLQLPRSYLSWSQASMWNKSGTHRDYFRRYFFGIKPTFQLDFMNFGKEISEAIENKTVHLLPENKRKVIEAIPKLDIPEYKAILKYPGFDVMGFIDHASKDLSEFIEYKTGVRWTQAQVDKHGQLDTYAKFVYQEKGFIPRVRLVSMEVKKNANGELEFTGWWKSFERKVTKNHLKKIDKYYIDTAQEISDHYQVYLKMLKYAA